jgi:hypothetical protein
MNALQREEEAYRSAKKCRHCGWPEPVAILRGNKCRDEGCVERIFGQMTLAERVRLIKAFPETAARLWHEEVQERKPGNK